MRGQKGLSYCTVRTATCTQRRTYGVSQRWPRVVPNNNSNPIVHPSLDGIPVVEASDSRWNQSGRGETCAVPQSDLLEPGNVKVDFPACVVVGSIVKLLVCKCVGNGSKGVEVVGEPRSNGIKLRTRQTPGVVGELWRPKVRPGA